LRLDVQGSYIFISNPANRHGTGADVEGRTEAWLVLLILGPILLAGVPARGATVAPATLRQNGNQQFLVDTHLPLLFFANVYSDDLLFINTTSGETIADLHVGAAPMSLDLSADDSTLYAALSGDTKIAVIDIASRSVTRTIELGFAPWSVRHSRPDRLVVSGASDGLVHFINETTGATLATVRPYLSLAIVEAAPNGTAFLVIDVGTDPVKIQRFASINDTPTFEAIDDHDLGINFQMEAVNWEQGVIYLALGGPYGYGYGVEMASAVSLNRLGLLGTAPYPALTALSPDRQTVYLETFGAGTADTVWAFNTSTGARLGTVSLDSPIQFMGAAADGESLVVADPVRRVSLRPFLSAAYPAPDAVLGFSPAFIEAQLHRGTQLSGLSQVAIDLNGRSLNTRILTGDVLRADLDTAVTDGAQTVAVTLVAASGTISTQWNFTVDSTLPVPGVEFATFQHPSGFRIPVPTTWKRATNVNLNGSIFELELTGPSGNVVTTIFVDTDRDPTVREDPSYFQSAAQNISTIITSTDPGAQRFEGPTSRRISNHSALTMAFLGSDAVIFKIALVVDESEARYWLILLTVDAAMYDSVNPIFEHMLSGFQTFPTESSLTAGLTVPVLAILITGLTADAILIFWAIRKSNASSSARPVLPAPLDPTIAVEPCPNCKTPLGPEDSYCRHCGRPRSP